MTPFSIQETPNLHKLVNENSPGDSHRETSNNTTSSNDTPPGTNSPTSNQEIQPNTFKSMLNLGIEISLRFNSDIDPKPFSKYMENVVKSKKFKTEKSASSSRTPPACNNLPSTLNSLKSNPTLTHHNQITSTNIQILQDKIDQLSKNVPTSTSPTNQFMQNQIVNAMQNNIPAYKRAQMDSTSSSDSNPKPKKKRRKSSAKRKNAQAACANSNSSKQPCLQQNILPLVLSSYGWASNLGHPGNFNFQNAQTPIAGSSATKNSNRGYTLPQINSLQLNGMPSMIMNSDSKSSTEQDLLKRQNLATTSTPKVKKDIKIKQEAKAENSDSHEDIDILTVPTRAQAIHTSGPPVASVSGNQHLAATSYPTIFLCNGECQAHQFPDSNYKYKISKAFYKIFTKLCQTISPEMLLFLTVQFLAGLQNDIFPDKKMLLECLNRGLNSISMSKQVIPPSQLLWMSKISASTSPNIEIIQSSDSLNFAISLALKNINTSSSNSQLFNPKPFIIASYLPESLTLNPAGNLNFPHQLENMSATRQTQPLQFCLIVRNSQQMNIENTSSENES